MLLLDEPTEGIQPSIIKDIARTLNEIKKSRDITIWWPNRCSASRLEIADRILVIEGGRLVHEEHRATFDAANIHRYLAV